MDETKRGIVIIDLIGDEPDQEGFGVEVKSTDEKKKLPEPMPPMLPMPQLEIVPVAPIKKNNKKN